MPRRWGLPALLLIPSLGLAQAPVQMTARATTTILQPTSARMIEELEVEIPYDELDEETEGETEVDVAPAAGGALNAPGGHSTGPQVKTKTASASKTKTAPATRRAQAASYVVGGLRRGSFAVSLPRGEDCVLTAQDARVIIKQLKLSVDNQAPDAKPGGISLDEKGTRTFRVGATLKLAAHQPRRTYRGQFNVTVAWN